MKKPAHHGEINYPDAAAIKHNQLKIDYKFEPGDSRDGATIDVPLLLLSQLRQVDIDWAVPGILRDKCIALLKSLPKAWRKQLIPVSGFVDEVLPLMSSNDGELLDALCDQIKILKNIAIERREFKEESLPPHLRVKIRVVDDKGSELAFGERLADLQQQLGVENEDSPTGADSGSFNHAIERSGLKDWDFDALPDSLQIGEELVLIRFPALVDNGTSVAINLFAEPGRALLEHQNGLIRLYMLRTPQQKKLIKKQFDEFQRKHVLKYAPGMKDLVEDAVFACYAEAFSVRSSSIRDRDAFARQYDRGRAQLADQANRMQKFLEKILNIRLKVMSSLSALPNEALGYAKADVREQIDHLLEPGFLRNTSWEWLQQYPRYFEGIVRRLDKAPHLGPKDVEATKELQLYWRRYKEKSDLGHTKLASEIDLLRWMIEEYRVSLFAQSLGTNVPVSAKRLDKRFQLLSE
jgi:ATP-dependent helicase HrpA